MTESEEYKNPLLLEANVARLEITSLQWTSYISNLKYLMTGMIHCQISRAVVEKIVHKIGFIDQDS